MPGAILIKKASQRSRPQTRKMKTIFHRHMRAGNNTSQTASVEFFAGQKKYRRARPCDIFHYVRLVSGADSAVGASIAAGTAVQASVCIDHIAGIALGNSTHGANICASAAADAGRADLISHKSTSIKICNLIVSQESQKASKFYLKKCHFVKRIQINFHVHNLFSKRSKKVKFSPLTFYRFVLYYNQSQRRSN